MVTYEYSIIINGTQLPKSHVVHTGSFQVVDNGLRSVTGQSTLHVESDSSGYTEVLIAPDYVNVVEESGVFFRGTDQDNGFYLLNQPSTGAIRLVQLIAGVIQPTNLIEGTGTLVSDAPRVLKAVYEGTQISIYEDDVQVGTTISSTFNQTGTLSGLLLGTETVSADNFTSQKPVPPPKTVTFGLPVEVQNVGNLYWSIARVSLDRVVITGQNLDTSNASITFVFEDSVNVTNGENLVLIITDTETVANYEDVLGWSTARVTIDGYQGYVEGFGQKVNSRGAWTAFTGYYVNDSWQHPNGHWYLTVADYTSGTVPQVDIDNGCVIGYIKDADFTAELNLNKVFRFPDNYSGNASTEVPVPEAGKILAWDPTGNRLVNVGPGIDGDTIFEVFEYSSDNGVTDAWHETFNPAHGDKWRRHATSTNGVISEWSLGYNLFAEDGLPGDTIYIEYRYSTDAINWHSVFADGDIWRSERTISNGAPTSGWSAAARIRGSDGADGEITEIAYEYSIDGLGLWHPNFSTGDHYRRERVEYFYTVLDRDNNTPYFVTPWSDAAKIVPVAGDDYGYKQSTVFLYQKSETRPNAPTAPVTYNFLTLGMSGLTEGWLEEVPAGKFDLWIAVASVWSLNDEDTIQPNEWVVELFGAAGQDGFNGSFNSYIYQNSATVPGPVPDEGAFDGATETFPTGWTDDITALQTNEVTYVSHARYIFDSVNEVWKRAGRVAGTSTGWSTVAEFVGGGKDGLDGNFVSFVFKNSETIPTTPVGGTFSGTSETFPTGWSDDPTSPTFPEKTWVSRNTYSMQEDGTWYQLDTWSLPTQWTGDDGYQSVTVRLYQLDIRNLETPSAPALPNGDVTYTFTTGAATGALNGWSTEPPSNSVANGIIWTTHNTAFAPASATTDILDAVNWVSPTILVLNPPGTDDLISAILPSITSTFEADMQNTVDASLVDYSTTLQVDEKLDVTFKEIGIEETEDGRVSIIEHINSVFDVYDTEKLVVENKQDVDSEIEALASDLSILNATTLPALQSDLAVLDDALISINTSTIPTLRDDLIILGADLAEVNTVTLPALQADLDALDGLFPIQEVSITDNAISSPKIQANAVTASKIIAGAISTDKLAANSITSDKIITNAITSDKIVANAISTDKMAANSINGDRVLTNTLNASKIVAGSISTDRMTANTINGDRILVNTLNADKIVANSITTGKIAANAITSTLITASAITSSKLATNSVTAVKIVAGAIAADKIATNAIISDKIAANAITSVKIDAAAITAAKIDADALNGKLITGTILRTAADTGSNHRVVIGDPSLPLWYGAGVTSTANGTFYVNSLGTAYAKNMVIEGTSIFKGALQGATGTFSGDLSAAGGTFSGSLSAVDGTFTGTVYAENIEGDVVDVATFDYWQYNFDNTATYETLLYFSIHSEKFDRTVTVEGLEIEWYYPSGPNIFTEGCTIQLTKDDVVVQTVVLNQSSYPQPPTFSAEVSANTSHEFKLRIKATTTGTAKAYGKSVVSIFKRSPNISFSSGPNFPPLQ